MGNAVELFGRELLFLAVTAALGSFLAVRIDRRFDRFAAALLAPALGLCLAVCGYTTANWFFSGEQLGWTLPVVLAIALLLCGVSVVRGRRAQEERPNNDRARRHAAVDLLQVVIVVLAVALPPSIALLRNDSVGPTTYRVYDTVGYVAESDSAQLESIQQARDASMPVDNPVENYWTSYLKDNQQLDLAPFTGTLDALIGLHATDTQSGFLIAVLVIAGLGAYAVVRMRLGRRSWFAVLAGALFGGPFFLQLFFDGSQGAIAGLSLLLPLVTLAACALSRPTRWNLALTAVFLAGLMTCYPVFVIPLAIASGIAAIGWVGIHLVRREYSVREVLIPWIPRILGVIIGAAVLDVVASVRDLHYWYALARGGYVSASLPHYQLGAGVVASWLLQTRELYTVAFGPQSAFNDIVPALLVPAAVIVSVVPALRRQRSLWFLLILIAVTCLLGSFEAVHNSCAYCEDRNLLPSEPALICVIAVGLSGLISSTRRWARNSAIVVSALMVSFVSYSLVNAWVRFTDNSYFLTGADRTVVSAVPKVGIVQLEGFGEGSNAPGEEPLTYELVFEATDDRVSIAADVDDREGLAYFGTQPLSGPWFSASYSYVLTRLPGIADSRVRLSSATGIGIDRRAEPVDVLVDSGLGLSMLPTQDGGGLGTIIAPLRLVVTGTLSHSTYVRASVQLPPNADTPEGTSGASENGIVHLCAQAVGDSTLRIASITSPTLIGGRLIALSANYSRCR